MVESAIEHTFELLMLFEKFEDAAELVNKSLDMVYDIKEKLSQETVQQANPGTQVAVINNLNLEFLFQNL